jgi:hypothetical protein
MVSFAIKSKYNAFSHIFFKHVCVARAYMLVFKKIEGKGNHMFGEIICLYSVCLKKM